MISFAVDGVVLDIEGTVSPIDFVYQRMFPFVRHELDEFLANHWQRPDVQQACRMVAQESECLGQFELLTESSATRSDAVATIRHEVLRLMDADSKSTGLKQLQGLIWRRGFESGELVAELFPDVDPRMREWHAAGIKLYIYSSGSIAAQQLFFGHTTAGDLRPLLSGYFDTTTGPKRDAASYRTIARNAGLPSLRLLFVSDVTAELAAASTAELQCVLAVRDGNPAQPDAAAWQQIANFNQLQVCAASS